MPIYKIEEQVENGEPIVRPPGGKVNWEGKERPCPYVHEGEFASDNEAIFHGKRQMLKDKKFMVSLRKDDKWVPIQRSDPNMDEGKFHGEL